MWANVRFRLSGSTDEQNHAVRARVLDQIAGYRVVELARLGPEILANVLPRIYPETLAAAYAHQDAGRPAYIVTAASHELAEMLARVLILDGGIGTRSEARERIAASAPDRPERERADGEAKPSPELVETHDLPALLARDALEARVRIDRDRMADRAQHRQVGDRVGVGV